MTGQAVPWRGRGYGGHIYLHFFIQKRTGAHGGRPLFLFQKTGELSGHARGRERIRIHQEDKFSAGLTAGKIAGAPETKIFPRFDYPAGGP